MEIVRQGGPAGQRVGPADATTPGVPRSVNRAMKNGGFAGFFEGYNPWKIGDADLAEKTAGFPLIVIRPTGMGNGAADPKGWAWIGWLAVLAALVLFLVLK